MSLPSTILRMAPQTLVVTRDNITATDGLAVFGAPTTFNIVASVQPDENSQLVDAGEGQYVWDQIIVWTQTQLQMRTSTTAPDRITYQGAQYRVTNANQYKILSNHWKCKAQKADVP